MRILVACEFSGIVRDAFLARGHDAWSCDLLPSERPGPHIQGDVRQVLCRRWDMMLAFPPCTYICRSGQWRWSDTIEMFDALRFVKLLMIAPIPRIALENPIGRISTSIRKPDQIIQPWQFGEGDTKATCLWLKGLPLLTPTDIVEDRDNYAARLPQRKRRQQERQRTYPGIAHAMAGQWG
jgi:hypothetical protein